MTDPTDRARRALLAIGLLSLAAGALVLAVPATVLWPWADDTLLVGFFTVAFVLASLLAPVTFLGSEPTREAARPPERVPEAPTPGDDLDVLSGRLGLLVPPARRRRIRSRLRRAAIRSLVRTAGCSTADTEARIEAGSWTDDPVAARFLDSDPESAIDRVLFGRRARRAARAILEASEEGADRR